jgi:hypothetical protein
MYSESQNDLFPFNLYLFIIFFFVSAGPVLRVSGIILRGTSPVGYPC